MAEENTPAPLPLDETWSAICPNDLGLKAGFLIPGQPVTFRSIVGWVTVSSRQLTSTVPVNRFFAVVISDIGFPVLAMFLEHHVGTFDKALTADQALQKSREWGGGPQLAPNMPIGKA